MSAPRKGLLGFASKPVGAIFVVFAAILAPFGLPAAFADSGPTFGTPGTYSYTVPPGVKQVTFDVFGAQGGSSNTSGGAGLGGEAKATIPVSVGDVFQITVGAAGGAGDYTGGSGGGAGDVRSGSCASLLTCVLTDRIIVAGGGGGGGGFGTFYRGPGNGGNGSGANGQSGGIDVNCGFVGGGGGTATAGGSAGTGRVNGSPGSLGTGGARGGSAAPGGAGGDGYYGGGGGAGDSGGAGEGFLCDGSGGGGGSGFITASAVVTFRGTGVESGNGRVVISTLSGTATTTTLTSSANPSTAGQQVTYSATVSPAPDGGTVQFSDNGTNVTGCSAQAVNTTTGLATCTLTYKTIGSHPITAAYVGDNNFLASTASLTQSVNVAPSTTTTLTSSTNPSTAGQQVTYTATVSPAPDGGTVQFNDNGTAITGCPPQAVNTTTGQATCAVTYTTAGSHPIAATYGGDPSYPTSSSSTLTQTVNPGPTTTTISSSVNPSALGQQVIYTATVSPAPDGGTVGFTDNGSTITGCSAQAVNTTTGDATCAVTYTTAGNHPIAASYGGDASYLISAAVLNPDQSVGTAITVTVSGHETYESATPSFSQSNNAPQGVTLTGTLSCSTVDGGGSVATIPVGSHTLDGASCSGLSSSNPNYYLKYQGANNGFVVTHDSTTTTVSETPTSVTYGNESASVFTVTVKTGNGEVLPSSSETSTVSVGTTSCVVTLVAGGQGASGTCAIANTPLVVGGPYAISAIYGGDADLSGSNGTAATGLSVTKDSTTTTVSETPSSVTYGNESASVFTVTVKTGNGEVLPSSSETSTVSVGTTSCVVTLVAGGQGASGTCAIANTPLVVGGPYAISAIYGGDADLSGSNGTAATGLSVTKDSTTTTVSETPSSVTYGNESASVFTVTVKTGNGEVLPSSSETSTVSVGTTSCVVTLTAGAQGASGTCAIANTPLVVGGPYAISAIYGGDADLSGSNGTAATGLSVTKDSTTTTVSETPSSVTYGNESASVFTVTVKTGNGEVLPSSSETSTVSVGTTSCVVTLVAGGQGASGTCAIANTPLVVGGPYAISAIYGGDADLSGSNGTAATGLSVTKDSTTTTVSETPSSVTYGNESASVFTVTVKTGNGEVLPSSSETSTVSVGTTSCVVTLTAGAQGASGTCAIANTPLVVGGPYAISAIYGGDADLSGSNGTAATGLSVTKDSTTTTVSETPSSVTYGNESASVFTVTVKTGNGEVLPSSSETSTVSVGTTSCVVTLTAGAQGASGTCAIANTPLVVGGPYAISAIYGGDADLSGSNGTAATGLSVTKDSTTTTVSETPSSVTYGNESASVFTVTVKTGNGEVLPSSSETSTVSVGTTSCVATLTAGAQGASGTCAIANTALHGGQYTATDTYIGDTDLQPSLRAGSFPFVVSLSLGPSTLPNGTTGAAYTSTAITVSGSTGSVSFVVTSGSLPSGLTLNASTGMISGQPSGTGTSSFTVTATDANGATGSRAYTITVCGGRFRSC